MNLLQHTITFPSELIRVDLFLSQKTGESREFVKKYKDSITVNKEPIKLSYILRLGDSISWSYPSPSLPPSTLTPLNIPLDILYEDEHLLVLNKMAGMVVHPSKGHWEGTLSHALLHHIGEKDDLDPLRPGIVHRLDKDTSGLMIIAKTLKTQKLLGEAFAERKILKIYTALVQGRLMNSHGKIDEPIGRSRKNRFLYAIDRLHGKDALTEYQVLETYSHTTLVKVRIHTGRTHQIRVHFKHLKHPIIGDILYSRSYKSPPLCLAATKIGFIHPITGAPLEFSIPVPPFFETQIKKMNHLA